MSGAAKERVLIFSHGHPELNPGGGEIASYSLFKQLIRTEGVEAFFVGRRDNKGQVDGKYFCLAGATQDDYFIRAQADSFRFSQRDFKLLLRELPDFLAFIQPTIIHFHHYTGLGLEFIRIAKRICPDARIVMTLHEYLAICNNNGQMVKTQTNSLCTSASPLLCQRCFPTNSIEDFFLRERFIKTHFDLVDVFAAPSEFLKARYIQWGLPSDRIVVIENGQEPDKPCAPRTKVGQEDARGRLAYFGQLNRYKGIDVLLEAMALIPKRLRAPKGPIRLDVYGANLEWEQLDFRSKLQSLFDQMKDFVFFHGSYRSWELRELMANIDWVVMPSIWWENSPLVIQEALKYKRPMIVSGIGGMAEKIRNGETGLHVRPGDKQALADTIVSAAQDGEQWDRLYASLPDPQTIEVTAAKYLRIYREAHLMSPRGGELEVFST